MKYRKILTPDGFDDLLEVELAYKNDVEIKLHNVFSSYGYRRIESPTLEYIEVFNNKGSMDLKNIFKFIDKDGEILALRPDITPSIARIVANNFDKKKIPYRFSYIDNTFAQNRNYQGKSRELTQAGVELIGLNSIRSDSEVILLAINSLVDTGLENFKIEIGDIRFLKGILLDLNLSNDKIKDIEQMIVRGNFAEVTEYTNNLDISKEYKEFFSNLFEFSGDFKIIEKARKFAKNQMSIDALNGLIEINKFLEDANVSEFVTFDLGKIGHFDYYTGIIFHGYTKDIGYSILDGGRYDKLIENFGVELPAIGFAIKVNEVVKALFEQNTIEFNRNKHTLIAYNNNSRQLALQTTFELRKNGLVFEYSLFEEIEDSKAYAKNNGFGGILNFKDNEIVEIIDIINNESNEVHIAELMGGEDNER